MLWQTFTRQQLEANGTAPGGMQTVDPSKLKVEAPKQDEKVASNTGITGNKWFWAVIVLFIAVVAFGIYYLVNRKK